MGPDRTHGLPPPLQKTPPVLGLPGRVGLATLPPLLKPSVPLSHVAQRTFKEFKKKWASRANTSLASHNGCALWEMGEDFLPYTYQPLTGPRRIRLWQITCVGHPKRYWSTLTDVPLDRSPPYVAISYTCGESTTRSLMPCNNDGFLQLTDSISVILDTILESGETVTLWVDAVCIDQSQNQEKSEQIQLMREIYSRARQVAIILGRPVDDSHEAMDFIPVLDYELKYSRFKKEPVSSESIGRNTGHHFPGPSWSALTKLLSRSWFRRVWIVQEVALGHKPVVICGDRAIEWQILVNMTYRIFRMGLEGLFTVSESDIHNRPYADGLSSIVDIHEAKVARADRELQMLQETLVRFRNFEATDPRDKVFAVLSLTVDANTRELRPDYAISARDVYVRTAAYLLLRDPTALILHSAGIGTPRALENLPSWVPDWTANSLNEWGSETEFHFPSGYHAGGHLLPKVRQGYKGESLIFRGLIVDQVEEVGEVRRRVLRSDHNAMRIQYVISATAWLLEAEAMIRRSASQISDGSDWQAVPYSHSSTGQETLHEAFWRTLITNTLQSSATSWGSHTLAAAEHGKYYDVYRSWLSPFEGEVSSRNISVGLEPEESQIYGWAHLNATENRRFLISQKGFIGLGNPEVKQGDVIAVIAGAATPFVLRRDEYSGSGRMKEEARFRLVGHAYVHGLMSGEALKMGPMADIELR